MPDTIVGPYPMSPPCCREPDARAATVARRVAELIQTRLPEVSVEHIGSTAVPGCAGKGIVDLMLLYPVGALERVKETLADLGFQRQTVGHLHPETRPMRVGALEEAGETFPLHLHVLAAASEEAALLRAFRDRLRADAELRAAYVACKREILAGGVKDCATYTRIKSDFVQRALREPASAPAPLPDHGHGASDVRSAAGTADPES